MRLLERVEEALVIAAFLRAELDSERFGSGLRTALARAGADETLVTRADLDDPAANARRRGVLADYRGEYLGANLDGLVWHRACLEPGEVLAIRYIAWDYWLELTRGSRLPTDGAATLQSRGEELQVATDAPPLIVVRASPSAHLVVVEGHVRLTALAMSLERLPPQLEVLLGEGASIGSWSLY